MRQELIFLKDWYKPGYVLRAKPVHLVQKPNNVFTLTNYQNPRKRPKLPFDPQNNVHVYMENYLHDWNWYARNGGMFDYFSRTIDRPVWILLEYND